jgi:thymidylate synthase
MNYLEIIKNVVNNGVAKQATRYDTAGNVIPVENGTIGTFCEVFRHDMSEGFPLTTLRKMPWRSIRVELEGFIKGVTDKRWFQERGCKFWSEWANPVAVKKSAIKKEEELKNIHNDKSVVLTREAYKSVQLETNDLGPIYGYQWRNFAKQYGEVKFRDFIEGGCCPATGEYQQIEENVNGLEGGVDQFKSIVDKLKTSPYDRRMVCSAWNPNQMHMMALPPCHWAWNIVVYDDKLNLIWHQRSCDLLLGVGANIASYGLLLMLLCKESGLKPGELVGTLADCHIYENHMEAAKQLIEREEKELPQIEILDKDGKFSIFDWEWKDVLLTNYNPHDKIDVGAVTV